MATIIIKEIPDELKRKFKAKCADEGITLKDAFITLMILSVKGRESNE